MPVINTEIYIDGTLFLESLSGVDVPYDVLSNGIEAESEAWTYSGTGTFLGFSTTQGATTPDENLAVGDSYSFVAGNTYYLYTVEVTATPKETFETNISALNDVLNEKAGATGQHTIAQMIDVAESIQTGGGTTPTELFAAQYVSDESISSGQPIKQTTSGAALIANPSDTETTVYCYTPEWSHDGTYFAYAGNYTKPLHLYRTSQIPYSVVTTPTIPYGGNGASCIAWSPDDKVLAIGLNNTTDSIYVMFYSTTTIPFTALTNIISSGEKPTSRPAQILWSPDGSKMAMITYSSGLYIYDTTQQPYTLLSNPSSLSTIDYDCRCAWSPDGTRFAITSSVSGVQIYNTSTVPFTLTQTITTSARTYGCTWSPDGKYFVFGQKSGTNVPGLYICDAQNEPYTIKTLKLLYQLSTLSGSSYSALEIKFKDNTSFAWLIRNSSAWYTSEIKDDMLITKPLNLTLNNTSTKYGIGYSPDGRYIAITGGGSASGPKPELSIVDLNNWKYHAVTVYSRSNGGLYGYSKTTNQINENGQASILFG